MATASIPFQQTPAGIAQRTEALAEAQRVRLARAALKAEIGAGRMTIAQAFDDPRSDGMAIFDLLDAQHRWGRARTFRFLRERRISELRRCVDLTPRERAEIAAALG